MYGYCQIVFDLRTCQTIYKEEATILFDKELYVTLEDIMVVGGPFFGDLHWRLAS
jgi:hypothetical protein